MNSNNKKNLLLLLCSLSILIQSVVSTKVLIIHSDEDGAALDVQSKLLSTNVVSQVSIWYSGIVGGLGTIPNITEASNYDLLFIWSRGTIVNPVALGDLVSSFLQLPQKGVVECAYSTFGISALTMSGGYSVIRPYTSSGMVSHINATLSSFNSSTMSFNGVHSFNGGLNSYQGNLVVNGGNIAAANWSTGNPLIILSPSYSLVVLNFYPVSNTYDYHNWDTSTDGVNLMRNAILQALGCGYSADCNNNPSDLCETSLFQLDNCGGCNVTCYIPNAVSSCETGECVLETCLSGECDIISSLIIYASATVNVLDIQNKLLASGHFNKVDIFDAGAATPDIGVLTTYHSVFIFNDSPFMNANLLSNNLLGFLESGRGIVMCAFSFGTTGGDFFIDLFSDQYYNVSNPQSGTNSYGYKGELGVVAYPTDPIMNGVLSFNGGTSSLLMDITPGMGTVVAYWNYGIPLVYRVGNPIVILNFFPPSSDVSVEYWDSDTDGDTLMVNALLSVSNCPYENCDGLSSNGCETNIDSDTNCGSCNTTCIDLNNQVNVCVSGECMYIGCVQGTGDCDDTIPGCETNLGTVGNCSACYDNCNSYFPNAEGRCQNYECIFYDCLTGFGNCDGNEENGCETFVDSNIAHCGSCNASCYVPYTLTSCSGGTCIENGCISSVNCTNSTVLVLSTGYPGTFLYNALEDTKIYQNVQLYSLYPNSGSIDLSYISQFSVVIVATSSPTYNSTEIGNILADYVDLGGAVILMMYSTTTTFRTYSPSILGRFYQEGYAPFTATAKIDSLDGVSMIMNIPDHELLTNVASFTLGPSYPYVADISAASGAIVVASYNSTQALGYNVPMVLYKNVGTDHVVPIVALNFEPISNNYNESYYGGFLGDGADIIMNAINFARNCFLSADCGNSKCESLSSLSNCGACGVGCSLNDSTSVCLDGVCQIHQCDFGYADCDNNDENGCETRLLSGENCSGCGDNCYDLHTNSFCDTNIGACKYTGICEPSYGDCNNDFADGCESYLVSNSSCDICGNTCDSSFPLLYYCHEYVLYNNGTECIPTCVCKENKQVLFLCYTQFPGQCTDIYDYIIDRGSAVGAFSIDVLPLISIPASMDLSKYDVLMVFTFSTMNVDNSTNLGNIIYNFYMNGGGVVQFGLGVYPSYGPRGSVLSILPYSYGGTFQRQNVNGYGSLFIPEGDPLEENMVTLYSYFIPYGFHMNASSTLVYVYNVSQEYELAFYHDRYVVLNFVPIAGYWDLNTDGDILIANAINVASCGTNSSIKYCNSICTNLGSDPYNCGSCGKSCYKANVAKAFCSSSVCGISSCTTGYQDRNGNYSDGCEQSITLISYCGNSGMNCSNYVGQSNITTVACINELCVITGCVNGYKDCDGIISNGCETNLFDPLTCGSCNTNCYASSPNLFLKPTCPNQTCKYLSCINSPIYPQNFDVLLIHNDYTYSNDVKSSLSKSGGFSTIYSWNVYQLGVPSIADIMNYTAVFFYTNGELDSNLSGSLGDALANYVTTYSGGVVVAGNNEGYFGLGLMGSFYNYLPFTPSEPFAKYPGDISISDQPKDPLLTNAGLMNFPGISSDYSFLARGNATASATTLASWTNSIESIPFIAIKQISRTPVVFLNLFPPSSAVIPNSWITGGEELFRNALYFAANAIPSVNCSSTCESMYNQATCGSCNFVCTNSCWYSCCGPAAGECNGISGCETLNTVSDCGACGNNCNASSYNVVDASCLNYECNLQCQTNFADCDTNPANGCETYLVSPQYCGSCTASVCPPNVQGTCTYTLGIYNCSYTDCSPGYDSCDSNPTNGCEVFLATDASHCGSCEINCMEFSNVASAECINGICYITQCLALYFDVNGNPTDGCEFYANNNTDCGSPGYNCDELPNVNISNTNCFSGICSISCSSSFEDCNSQSDDGCEVDLASDPNHCGACNILCPTYAYSLPQCVNNSCSSVGCSFSECPSIDLLVLADPSDNYGIKLCDKLTDYNINCSVVSDPAAVPTEQSFLQYDVLLFMIEISYHEVISPFFTKAVANGVGIVLTLQSISYNGMDAFDSKFFAYSPLPKGYNSPIFTPDSLSTGSTSLLMDGVNKVTSYEQVIINTTSNNAQIESYWSGSNPSVFYKLNSAPAANVVVLNMEPLGVLYNPNGFDPRTDGYQLVANSVAFAAGRACYFSAADCGGNGSCTSTKSVFNCGSCGNVCTAPNTLSTECKGGVCIISQCAAHYYDIDRKFSNGCEYFANTAATCGTLSTTCIDLPNVVVSSCSAFNCVINSCASGWKDCNNDVSDGCESHYLTDIFNCGGCNNSCTATSSLVPFCQNGTCQSQCTSSTVSVLILYNENVAEATVTHVRNGLLTYASISLVNSINVAIESSYTTGDWQNLYSYFMSYDVLLLYGVSDVFYYNQNVVGAAVNYYILNGGGVVKALSTLCQYATTIGEGNCNLGPPIVNSTTPYYFSFSSDFAYDYTAVSSTLISSHPLMKNVTSFGPAYISKSVSSVPGTIVASWSTSSGNYPLVSYDSIYVNSRPVVYLNYFPVDRYYHSLGYVGSGGLTILYNAVQFAAKRDYSDCVTPGSCTTSLNTATNCGACGYNCSTLPHAAGSCTSGFCNIATCNSGYADCDRVSVNGCETQVNAIASPYCDDCTNCNDFSPPNVEQTTCNGGTCSILYCSAGYADCNSIFLDGCEATITNSTSSCGYCDVQCSFPNAIPSCDQGTCVISQCVNLLCTGTLEVLVLYSVDDITYAQDVVDKLQSTSYFASVSSLNVGTSTPTLDFLQQYDSVLIFNNAPFDNSIILGDVIADYLENDGGLVHCLYSAGISTNYYDNFESSKNTTSYYYYDSYAILGNYVKLSYSPVVVSPNAEEFIYNFVDENVTTEIYLNTDSKGIYNLNSATIQVDYHLIKGISSFDGGSNSLVSPLQVAKYLDEMVTVPMNIEVFDQSQNIIFSAPFIVSSMFKNVVVLNLFPPSSTVYPGGWDASTDGAIIMANALLSTASCRISTDNCDNNSCVTLNSAAHCGDCNNACIYPGGIGICVNGSCQLESCSSGFKNCDGIESNGCEPLNSLYNCGDCNRICSIPNAIPTCESGICDIFECDFNYTNCDGLINTGCETSGSCDLCSVVCNLNNTQSFTCNNTDCYVETCIPGFANCDGQDNNGCEVDVNTNVNNCGACNVACSFPNATAFCNAGKCNYTCDSPYLDCTSSAGCETYPSTSNCLACGTVCSFPHASSICDPIKGCKLSGCVIGYQDCNADPSDGCEINLSSDILNCGSCNKTCSLPHATPICSGSSCLISSCLQYWKNCDNSDNNGCETDSNSNVNYCGNCTNDCTSYPNIEAVSCLSGACNIISCATGFGDCSKGSADGCETDIQTSLKNCGNCGNNCNSLNNVNSTACNNGICEISSCISNYANCDESVVNGCEISTLNDTNNCGSCGIQCAPPLNSVSACVNGSCTYSCQIGYADCDSIPGCEDNAQLCCTLPLADCDHVGNDCEVNISSSISNCGACGAQCFMGTGTLTTCVNGSCVYVCAPGFSDCDKQDGCETYGVCPCPTGQIDCNQNDGIFCESYLNSTTTCGSCINDCSQLDSSYHAVRACNSTTFQCYTASCQPGHLDCDANPDDCEYIGPYCPLNCPSFTADCDGQEGNACETDLRTLTDCGRCGAVCAYNNTVTSCPFGVCTVNKCATGWKDCNLNITTDGCETNIQTLTNCGGCNVNCALPNADVSCSTGICEVTACHTGFYKCGIDVGCSTPVSSSDCSACGDSCTPPVSYHSSGFCNTTAPNPVCEYQCNTGFEDCYTDIPGCETDIFNSISNCGACRNVCFFDHSTATCKQGVCGFICDTNYGNCDSNFTNGCEQSLNDIHFCGDCNTVCNLPFTATTQCLSGSCTIGSCLPDYKDCNQIPSDGCETNMNSTLTCGGCSTICNIPNAISSCLYNTTSQKYECEIASCTSGFADCNNITTDGCEVSITNNGGNCGSCNLQCSLPNALSICSNSKCIIQQCSANYYDCNKNNSDGCETSLTSPSSCGGCTNDCSGLPNSLTTACNSGICVPLSCVPGFGDCSTAAGCETDLSSSQNNCGGCNHACKSDEKCQNFTCVSILFSLSPTSSMSITPTMSPKVQGSFDPNLAPPGSESNLDPTSPPSISASKSVLNHAGVSPSPPPAISISAGTSGSPSNVDVCTSYSCTQIDLIPTQNGDSTSIPITTSNGVTVGTIIVGPQDNSNVYVTIAPGSAPHSNNAVSVQIDINIYDMKGNEITTLNSPITICLSSNSNPKKSCLSYYDTATQEWKCQDSCLKNGDNGTVCGTSPHATSFAILLDSSGGGNSCDGSTTLDAYFWISLAFVIAAIVIFFLIAGVYEIKMRMANYAYWNRVSRASQSLADSFK